MLLCVPASCPVVRGTPGQGSPEGCACLRGPDGSLLPWAAGSLLSPREDALSSCRLPTLLALLGHSCHCLKDPDHHPVGKTATTPPKKCPIHALPLPPRPCWKLCGPGPAASSHTPSPLSLGRPCSTRCPMPSSCHWPFGFSLSLPAPLCAPGL